MNECNVPNCPCKILGPFSFLLSNMPIEELKKLMITKRPVTIGSLLFTTKQLRRLLYFRIQDVRLN